MWGVAVVGAIGGLFASGPLAWALRTRAWAWIAAAAFGWWAGWMLGVAIAGALELGGGATPTVWAMEHAVIAGVIGIAWGSASSPGARRFFEQRRVLISVR